MSDFISGLPHLLCGWMQTAETYFFPTLPTVAACLAAVVPATWLMKRLLRKRSKKKRSVSTRNVSSGQIPQPAILKPFLVEELTLLTQDESDSDSDNPPHVKNDSDIGPHVKNNLDNTPLKNDSNMVPPVKNDLDIKACVKNDMDVGPPDKLDSDIHEGIHVKIESDVGPHVKNDADIGHHFKNDSDHTSPVTNGAGNTSSEKNDTDKAKNETEFTKETTDAGKPKKETKPPKKIAYLDKPNKETGPPKELPFSNKPKKETGPPKELPVSNTPKKERGPPKDKANDLEKILDWALEQKKTQKPKRKIGKTKCYDEIRSLHSGKRKGITEEQRAKQKRRGETFIWSERERMPYHEWMKIVTGKEPEPQMPRKEDVREERQKPLELLMDPEVAERMEQGEAEVTMVSDNWDEEIRKACEEELTDVSVVLHARWNKYNSPEYRKTELKRYSLEPDNATDVEKTLRQVQNNNPELKHLNLNNIKDIPYRTIVELFDSLKTNTNLITLELASVDIIDGMTRKLLDSLLVNRTLRVLNLESNFLSGKRIIKILKAINENQTVVELRLANQDQASLGPKIEAEITELVLQNYTILRLGIAFEFPDSRHRVTTKLIENMDEDRKKRLTDRAGMVVKELIHINQLKIVF